MRIQGYRGHILGGLIAVTGTIVVILIIRCDQVTVAAKKNRGTHLRGILETCKSD
jgi:uncharacterized membrane protein